MGHGARALLSLAERLLRFQHLGALQSPDLERDLFHRRGRDGEHAAQLRVPISLHDLGRRRRRRQAELAAHLVLDLGLDVREVSHGA